MMRLPVLAAVAAAAIAAPGAARDRNAVPEATPTGPSRTCVPLRDLHESRVRSDSIIDFRIAGDRYYRVTLPQACPGLNFERSFSYSTSIGQLCAQDIITVVRNVTPMRGASCGLAPFQPVRIARKSQ
jgi:hypothetical protein